MPQAVPHTQTEIPWKSLKKTIKELYLRQNKTNKEIIQYVAEARDGLTITKHQLEYRLKKWKIRKNLKKEDYILAQIEIEKSKSIGSVGRAMHEVYLNGVRQSSRKLRKGFWRHRAFEEARRASVSELQYYISDGLEITKPMLSQNASGSQQDNAHLQSSGLRLVAQTSHEVTDEPIANYDIDMHDLAPDLYPHARIENSHVTRNVLEPSRTASGVCLSIIRTRETNFIYDFIQRTLSVMHNEFWDDLEWEPKVLKLLKTHKLDSLLTCIVSMDTKESVKLGNYLVGAVCHKYQENYGSDDLYVLLLCGCKPSAETLNATYRCEDIRKIQHLRQFWGGMGSEIHSQCQLGLQHISTAILEVLALSAGINRHTPLPHVCKLYEQGGLPFGPSWEFLTFNGHATVDFKFKPLPMNEWPYDWGRDYMDPMIDLSCINLLMKAINNRHKNVIRFLSSRMDLQNPSYLLYAISMGDEATTRVLLEAGADPSKCSFILETCEPSRLSLRAPSIRFKKMYSVTPLLIAVRSNFGRIINRLLSAGADPKLTGSVPPLYWCVEDDTRCSWKSECQYLKTFFEEISPLELAVVRGCGIGILEGLWVPDTQFRRPEVMWVFLLMYKPIESPEFDFIAEALLASQFGWDLNYLQKTRRRRRFHLRRNQNISKSEYTLLLDAPALDPSGLVIQTYNSDQFGSMIYHATKCWGESHREAIIANLNFHIPLHDASSREQNSIRALRFAKYAQRLGWDINLEHRSAFMRSIIKSAWRGVIDISALNKYLQYFSGSNESDSGPYPPVIQLLQRTNVSDNITKLFVEAIDESECGGQGAIDQCVFEVFEYFIDIGWDINEGACPCGETTVLDVVLDKFVPNSTTFAMVKRLCDAGARINHGKTHYSALSRAIMARRKVFRESFDRGECWALRVIEHLLQVEKQRGYIYDVYALGTKIWGFLGTPLQEAAYYGDLKLARLLIEAGMYADLEKTLDWQDYSPWGQISLSKCSKSGAWAHDLKSPTPCFLGWTPLELAVEKGRQDTVILLLQAGAKVTEWALSQPGVAPQKSGYGTVTSRDGGSAVVELCVVSVVFGAPFPEARPLFVLTQIFLDEFLFPRI
ncbi:hypothetical protein TWF703_009714 [Orbilia oligospora]|uniref:Clr5 domain-containing protein n=1 Tax=Orbilia oligospora TaxID=2813651 RepID=A0A7C8P420_ORBOL|nr:hypothetical protein TWF703_009714 [Orbilia oligospora]